MINLLTRCAGVELTPAQLNQLAAQAGHLSDWSALPAAAEAQSLGPLVYYHLKAARVDYPTPVKRDLQGLYLRHRHANTVKLAVLVEILAALEAAGIEALVLKGAALATLIYPEPGLRPMRDLDVLVHPAQVRQAQGVLGELGFNAPLPPPGSPLPDKHLAVASRRQDGLTVSIEVHYNLFEAFQSASLTLEALTGPPHPFKLNEFTAHTLGHEDMLWHLCRHIAYHASIWEPIRLIWVVDLVGFAEQFVEQIDWPHLARLYPPVLKLLSLFHFVTPVSDRLRQQAGLKLDRAPQGIGLEFDGWPRRRGAQLQAQSWSEIARATFFPSEWWLRLHYGLDCMQPLFWYRWVRHPLYILGPFYLLEKLRLWWYLRARPRLKTISARV